MKPGRASLRKEAVRYHLHQEAVKKTVAATDDVFRILCSVSRATPGVMACGMDGEYALMLQKEAVLTSESACCHTKEVGTPSVQFLDKPMSAR